MDFILIRHADALALGERGITDDADRPLSEKGENQAVNLARGLLQNGIQLDKVVTSPLVRAKQTAEILIRNWSSIPLEIHLSPALAPDGKPRKLIRFLEKLGGDRIALVGHVPHLPHLAGWLVGGKKAKINMSKAGVAFISCPEGPGKGLGTLQWLLNLDLLQNKS